MTDTTNLYALSDEELATLDLDKLASENAEPDTDTQQPQTDENRDVEVTTEEPQQKADVEVTDTTDDTTDDVIDKPTDDTEPADEQTDDTAMDYSKFHELITKPFKANGREITITDPKDVVSLMQRGIDYSRKMEKLKPNLALVKTLEEHGLTDKEKLGYMVDLLNKKPEAIAKLVKDAQIDLYSFDTEQDVDYKPYLTVNEHTQLEDVMNELLETTEHFSGVLNDIANNWDSKSKELLQERPDTLRAMTQHNELGLYKQIVDKVEYQRMLGRLTDVPFIVAYSQMEGQVLSEYQQQQAKQQTFTGTRPNTSTADNPKRNKASLPNNGGTNVTDEPDLSKMSDTELAEFLKNYT